jgi:hypothetical protein
MHPSVVYRFSCEWIDYVSPTSHLAVDRSMPTDRISSSSSLLETLRALARDRARGVGTHSGVAAKESAGELPRPVPHSVDELRQRLHTLVSHVDVADAKSLAEAREPALREILLWEFGSDFRKDSQFLPMVDAISQTLDADPRFQQRFADMVAGLQKS